MMMKYFFSMIAMMCVCATVWAEDGNVKMIDTRTHCADHVVSHQSDSQAPVCVLEEEILPFSDSVSVRLASNYIENRSIKTGVEGSVYSEQGNRQAGVVLAVNGQPLRGMDWQEISLSDRAAPLVLKIQSFVQPHSSAGGNVSVLPAGTLLEVKDRDQHIRSIPITGINVQKVQPACELVSSPNTVDLKQINSGDIRHKGDEIKGGEAIVKLKCPKRLKVYAAFTDAKDPNQTSQILTNKGTAQGVGLKLYWQGQSPALSFGTAPKEDVFDAPNQILLSQNDVAPQLTLDVYYVNTDGAIMAGSVESAVMITFSYQ